MPESGAATAWRRVRCRPRLVVHAGSQAAATDPARPTVAGFRPAARLRRSRNAGSLASAVRRAVSLLSAFIHDNARLAKGVRRCPVCGKSTCELSCIDYISELPIFLRFRFLILA